ncbi:MAG TPA: hypothetical protein DF364_00720 [Ruminococcaceae bacterium]|nr:hypothetical protein [Oscillospiraceae bacterium]
MPQTDFGSVSEPRISGSRKMAPNRSQNKIFFKKPYIFRIPVIYHMREKVLSSKARFLPLLAAYLLREKTIFIKALIFSLSRDLPFEERKNFENDSPNDLSYLE